VRIAYLSSDPGVPVFGTKGASIHVRELSRSLQELGNDVTVVAARTGGDRPSGYDVPVVTVEPDLDDERLIELLRADPGGGRTIAGDLRFVLAASSLRERGVPLLRALGPDLIYERYALYGTAGMAMARDLDVPRILEVNARLSQEQERHRGLAFSSTARELETSVLRSAGHVVAVSSILRRWVIDAGVPPDRVTVLSNGVDPERFRPERDERDAVRGRLGLANRPVVGFVGTLKPWHDVATLLRAMDLVAPGEAPPHLLIVGDGPERTRLEDLAWNLGSSHAVTFTGGVPHERITEYVGALDVAVLPYGADGDYFSPLKLFEYLAAERPVVAAAVGDIGHCVRNGETGLTYTPGDPTSLAEAISALLRDHPWAGTLARKGRDHVRAYHTWEGNAREVVRLAEGLVGRRPVEVAT
jgi:glycosyltransferase involved in cell wall biosynthesis